MNDFFGLLAAGPAFFVSTWLLMLFARSTASDVGIRPFGYVTWVWLFWSEGQAARSKPGW